MSLTKASYSMISGSPINVLDYGADPTGVSSSSAAFQAAVTAVGYGGAIFIPEGTYKFNATVNVPPTASLDSAITYTISSIATLYSFFRLSFIQLLVHQYLSTESLHHHTPF